MNAGATIDWDGLQAAAEAVLPRAHAPYSGFHVAAALLAQDGRVFVGVNVENASYGLTVCAERNAVAAAVVAGCTRFSALFIVCSGPTPVTPCGACRQVLSEFPPAMPLRCVGADGAQLELDSGELLPAAFRDSDFIR